ncbi:MAG: PepSY-associated TM helix domain-containing protein [Methylococcales bacterium]
MNQTIDELSGKAIELLQKSKSDPLARLKSRRKLWLTVHLYLGLSAGLLLAVVGLTGSISVFYVELQEILNPEKNVVSVPTNPEQQLPGLDKIIASAESAKPPGSHFFKVYYPRNEHAAYKLLYFFKAVNQTNNGDGYYIFVDPYTMQVKGLQLWHPKDKYWGRPLMSFIMQLHWCLLLGETGGIIVGILAALSIISVLTGLIVWWPLGGKFKQALTFKRHAGAVRFNFDLHKTVGFYTSIVLLPVLFSGIYMNLPERVNVLLKLFSPITRANAYDGIDDERYHSSPQANKLPIGYSAAVAAVEQRYPAGQMVMVNAPVDASGVYIIQKREVKQNSRFVGHQTLVVDQYSGDIIHVYNAGMGNKGDLLLDWQWPLHSGQAFGWAGRILVLLAGLACPLLYVTGVMRWLQKHRAAGSHNRNKRV